ncbi:hypothetical protein MMYC01_204488 [Madurella mycetomatis]|uniref:N-acetyltransferase domain-containing protein n=1 Tax=Madurella mycetomatis TaxID=100816 RepID=A0A175W4Y5_9PEZI|nr:hypothetical protein MMYC01_205295 [Madurella mycetomatis]KXX79562.1 hypothetical protein MMYC01_204488 [Madurella mycetomatis]
MELPSQEVADLAFGLFDRYGRLDHDYYEHEFRKGTGVWGKELDEGDLLLFKSLKVDPAFRRRGLGTKIVNAILEKARTKVDKSVGFFAIAKPGVLLSGSERSGMAPEEKQPTIERMMRISTSFWRSLGFRRVGTSAWFARAESPEHPSRHVELAQDWEGPDDAAATLSDDLERLFGKLADPTADELECINDVRKTFLDDHEGQQWQAFDRDGNTLLHIAAMSSKPELVKFVLSKVSHLARMRNKEGYTPLEALQNKLERQRTRESDGHRFSVRSDAFGGFGPSSIASLAAFENSNAFDLSTLSLQDIEAISSTTDQEINMNPQLDIAGIRKTLRLKYGCTCGKCVGGFLSPRMSLALLCVAEIEYDILKDSMSLTGPGWVNYNGDLLTYLPDNVRENMKTNKSMREGFSNMFDHFAQCLRQGVLPTEQTVLDVLRLERSEWPPVTRNFLQRGGTVASVSTMIFEMAMNDDEWAGDGSHRDTFGGEIDALVECRNDHEFGFVSGMCGYKRIRPDTSCFVDTDGEVLNLD